MMKPAVLAIAFAFATLLSGCAVHTKETIATVRAAGVPESTVNKLAKRGVLTPEDIIGLTRRGVDDAVIIRQLEEVGVDYAVMGDDVKKLRAAKVSRDVISALIVAGDRWRWQRIAQAQRFYYYDSDWGYYPPYFGGPWGWPYSGISVRYFAGRHHDGGHRHHDSGHGHHRR
jgi:hypothetical protein